MFENPFDLPQDLIALLHSSAPVILGTIAIIFSLIISAAALDRGQLYRRRRVYPHGRSAEPELLLGRTSRPPIGGPSRQVRD